MTLCPALQQASTDTSVKGAPVRVLLYLHTSGALDYLEYRPLKLWPVAEALSMDKGDLGRAVKRLTQQGYIREGNRTAHGGRTYRLAYSRALKTA